ncbi:MAG: ankyrin repeat domain-containing protein, partial [Rhodospirillales bacterium]|nr:ankyrin repeat domain-containing protein [Rhodospirillales bacterium]
MITAPTDSTSRTSAVAVKGGWRWMVCVAALVLALLLAFEAAAQSTATTGLSGPTLRLFKAVELNDIAAVKGSLDDGADIAKENADGMTAADLAVDMGHFIIAHYLLSRKLLGEATPVMLAPAPTRDTATASPAAKPK